jgi:hypothetical protein
MKLLTTITAAALVMAATGCETMEQKGYIMNEYGDWIRPGERYFGDSKPGEFVRVAATSASAVAQRGESRRGHAAHAEPYSGH